jgi:PIN domain nuclease of toxin-antitoxin system
MAVNVVDASAVAALLFNEPAGEGVGRQLGTDSLAAPSLLP